MRFTAQKPCKKPFWEMGQMRVLHAFQWLPPLNSKFHKTIE